MPLANRCPAARAGPPMLQSHGPRPREGPPTRRRQRLYQPQHRREGTRVSACSCWWRAVAVSPSAVQDLQTERGRRKRRPGLADPRLSPFSLVTQLPVSTEPAETVLQRRLRRHTGVSGPLLHRYTALRRNRRSRDGVALRSERSAVAGSTPGAVRPADASTDLVPPA
jgi:hypothetical protein